MASRYALEETIRWLEEERDRRDAKIARLTAALANTQADFAALQRALVGNTGASAIETAAALTEKLRVAVEALKIARKLLPIGYAATGRPGGADPKNAQLDLLDTALARLQSKDDANG